MRPERLRLAPVGSAPDGSNSWPATIESLTYLGSRFELRLRLADGTIATADAPNDGMNRWLVGAAATAWFMPDDAWVIADSVPA